MKWTPQLVAASSEETGPFSRIWPFDAGSDSAYDFTASSVDLTGGVCRLTAADQLDDGNTCSGFGDGSTPNCGGTFRGVAWGEANTLAPSYSSHEVLRLDQSGIPTNRAEFDASWTPAYSSLVAYWKMNGTWEDEIGANDGVASGGATFTTAAKIGAQAGLFDGTNDYVDPGTQASMNIANNAAFTLAGWFKATDDYGPIVAFRNSTDVDSQLAVYIGQDGTTTNAGDIMAVVSGDAGGGSANVRGYRVDQGTWHHFVVVRAAASTTIELYIDGVSQGTATGAGAGGAITTDFRAFGFDRRWNADGGRTADELYFGGSVDDVALWSTNLTNAQIQIVYSRQSAKYSGSFASRVMNAFDPGQSWTSFAWVPSLPFAKSLPDAGCAAPCAHANSESSTSYSALAGSTGALENPGSTADDLMDGILALWHFDETAATGGANNDFADLSGAGGYGEQANGVTFGVPGAVHLAANLDGTNDGITLSTGLPKAAGTLSHWLMVTTSATNEKRSAYYESNISNNGWTTNVQGNGDLEINTGMFDGYWAAAYQDDNITQSGGLDYYKTTAPVIPWKWTHFVMTWDRAGDLKIYIDGAEVFSVTISGTTYASLAANYRNLGRVADGTGARGWRGRVDELAIWDRPLHATEVHQLYRRGANRILYQARVCVASDCSDDPNGANWKGPDGSRYSYFSEFHNTSFYNAATNVPTGNVLKTLPNLLFASFNSALGAGQYFQYRAILESNDAGSGCNYGAGATWCSPELKSASAGPTHYDPTFPTVVGKTGVSFTSLSDFVETLGASCASGVSYNLGVGPSSAAATWYYWTGAAWATANGTIAQASPATDIAANIASFASVAGTGTVYFKAFLGSDGESACELNALQLDGVR